MAAQVEAPYAEGVSSKLSSFSVPETVRRLEETVRAKGLTLFARIDHGGGARGVGLDMREEQLIVFGNPRLGTPLMVARPLVGLELPLRVLVWRDAEGRVWVSYDETGTGLQENGDAAVIHWALGGLLFGVCGGGLMEAPSRSRTPQWLVALGAALLAVRHPLGPRQGARGSLHG